MKVGYHVVGGQSRSRKENQKKGNYITHYLLLMFLRLASSLKKLPPSRLYVCFSDVQCGVYALQILP